MDSELTNLAAVKAIDQGLTTTSNVTFNNVIATGNLDVQGTTTTLNTTNLNVEDQFILVNSGSNSKDAGIIFGGTGGTNQQGKALIWDYSFNSNDGRLAVSTTDVAWNNTTNFAGGTAGYYVAGVFIGSLEDAAKNVFSIIKTKRSIKYTILFSPCAASFDSFKNFEERGLYFNRLVKKFMYGK